MVNSRAEYSNRDLRADLRLVVIYFLLNIALNLLNTCRAAMSNFPGLMHLGIALAVFVLGRAGCMNNGRVDDSVLA